MRKIVVYELLSLDGVAQDPDKFFTAWDDTGPVILVGHSYGGAVITNAATGDNQVKAPELLAMAQQAHAASP